MLPAPIPANDAERLQVLHALLILDTPPEERFDRIVNFIAGEFDVPIALVSLIDLNRQWFKARTGLDVCQTARDISFCGHVVASGEPLIINDARTDERFADNPFVTGEPGIRFYAGFPLVLASGHVVGTLCLIDRKPRYLDEYDLSILATVRDLVVAELSGAAR